MDKLDIILWVMSGGFSLMLLMWHSLNTKIEKVESDLGAKIDKVESILDSKIDKLDEKLTDVDRRLCRLEGAFSSKDCCMIKDETHIRKAE